MAQNFTTEDYHSEELEGCRLENNSEIVGLVAFCTQYLSNKTSYLLPRTVTRLQLFSVYNLPPNVPLAPNLEQLLILEISSCKLQKITSYMFEGFKNLTRISLKHNYLAKLPSDAFKHNLLLETINLSENYLFSINGIAPSLRSLKLLKNLDLSKNRALNWISDHDFEPLQYTSLKVLDLSDCELSQIDRNAFQWLRYLVSLNVSRTHLGDVALQNLSYSLSKESLKFFSISELKNISYFPQRIFSWLADSDIEYLDLSKNRFSYSFFQVHSHFKILNVDYCDIMLLPFEVISEMPFLEVLKMKHHFVTKINQHFKMVRKLKILDMSEFATVIDRITVTIADFAFENLKELELLDLSLLPLRNGIQRNTFSGLSNLKELHLLNCYIYQLKIILSKH
ncbi:toll-like receptor 8 [Caerostris darwini]|uniref:Toll-like receptor 8 n=1 Tax=Caerostris darwini TaxID=1538125 RepID=A0AAV4X6U4_9ARAC|nr:toll-like receptor 8 [Caerostris darwini]